MKVLKIQIMLLVVSILLFGCNGKAQGPAMEQVEDPVSLASPTEENSATDSATAEPTEVPAQPTEIVQPTLEIIIEPTQIADQCIDCHVDKERLIDTADEEEEVVSENEGEG